MGYPADGGESLYRNKKQIVIQYLKKNHGNNVKVYNLCYEKSK
jgi:hypothetical protein